MSIRTQLVEISKWFDDNPRPGNHPVVIYLQCTRKTAMRAGAKPRKGDRRGPLYYHGREVHLQAKPKPTPGVQHVIT